MHIRVKLLFVLAAIAAAAVVAVPSGSAKTECNGFFVGQTVSGGLVVNNGDFCGIVGSTVSGGVTQNGGSLDIEVSTIGGGLTSKGGDFYVFGSTISGGWMITGTAFSFFDLCANNVTGGLKVTNDTSTGTVFSFGEANAGCAGGTIGGGATFTNNPNVATMELDSYTVSGGVTFAGNGGLNELEGTTVSGAASCQAGTVNDGDGGPNSYRDGNNGCPP
jgi:hypothetical protein